MFAVQLLSLNNFIHHKSGNDEYQDKQTNITQLTLSSTYMTFWHRMCSHAPCCRGAAIWHVCHKRRNGDYSIIINVCCVIQPLLKTAFSLC